jgi:hypothetical protein
MTAPMARRRGWRLAALLALAALAGGCDTIRVVNAAGDVGLLVDGARSGVVVDDQACVASRSGSFDFDLANLEPATGVDQWNLAIGFGADHAPTYLDTPWTAATETFAMTLNAPVPVSLTIWIVQGPYADQQLHAAAAVAYLSGVWQAERAGLVIDTVTYVDATADPDITPALLDSTGGDARNWDDFSTLIGEDTARLNVYWIRTVENSTTTGWSDFNRRIVMGEATNDDLLVHEVGHAMNLVHPGTFDPEFGSTNVMFPWSVVREFLTEGQTFRAHFDVGSAANDVFGANPAEPKTNCNGLVGSSLCPALNRRLWADGDKPAN